MSMLAGISATFALDVAPGHAGMDPLPFGPMQDPRTAGILPPGLAAPTETLRPALEAPGGKAWVRGEVPSGVVRPDHALRSASATAGIRLPLVTATGFTWAVKPTLSASASAAAHPERSIVYPGLGVALGQTISLSLPFGLQFAAESTVGDRVSVGSLAGTPASSALALRTRANLSTELAWPFLGTPMRIGFGLTTAGLLPGGPITAAYRQDAAECAVSLEIAKLGSAPLRISARCPGSAGTVPPITVAFRTEF
ncbi:hypothetical protein GCM10011504_55410 [Siccirubricoccus deserti]|nr:hypothetical protein GCM10011504_55410 [Siccirubricoccus deserti]